MAVYCTTQAQADAEMDEWLQQAPGIAMMGPWGAQCSRLVQQYSKDLFGLSPYDTLGYGNARDHITNANRAYFEAVWNDAKNAALLPRKGDAMVFNGKPLWDGKLYGHTGVTSLPKAVTVQMVQQDGATPPTFLHTDGNYYSKRPAHYGTFAYVGDPGVGSARGWVRPRFRKVLYTGADKRLGRVTPTAPATTPVARVLDWVDVSNHQPATVLRNVATDAAVIKASEGVGFRDPVMADHVSAARAKRIPYMLYHFARGTQNSSGAEVRLFRSVVDGYLSDPLCAGLVLDFEEDAIMHYGRWGDDFLAQLRKELPGTPLVLYTRAGFLAASGWSQETKNQTPVWIAAYGTDQRMTGYATSFAGAPSVAGWSISAWQYSQRGRLPGYAGDLDLNRTLPGRVPMWPSLATASSTDPDDLMEWIVNNRDEVKKLLEEVHREEGARQARGSTNDVLSPDGAYGTQALDNIAEAVFQKLRGWIIEGIGSAQGPMTLEQHLKHERDERGKDIGARIDTAAALQTIAVALKALRDQAQATATIDNIELTRVLGRAAVEPEPAEPVEVILSGPDGQISITPEQYAALTQKEA